MHAYVYVYMNAFNSIQSEVFEVTENNRDATDIGIQIHPQHLRGEGGKELAF